VSRPRTLRSTARKTSSTTISPQRATTTLKSRFCGWLANSLERQIWRLSRSERKTRKRRVWSHCSVWLGSCSASCRGVDRSQSDSSVRGGNGSGRRPAVARRRRCKNVKRGNCWVLLTLCFAGAVKKIGFKKKLEEKSSRKNKKSYEEKKVFRMLWAIFDKKTIHFPVFKKAQMQIFHKTK